MAEVNYVNVGVIQLDAGQNNTIRFNVLVPFYTDATTYDQLSDGIAWRLTQQAIAPANFILVDELTEQDSITRSKGPNLKDSVGIVSALQPPKYLVAGIRAFTLESDQLAANMSLLADHMELATSLAGNDANPRSPQSLNVTIVLDGRAHRKRVIPTWTVDDLMENCGPDVARIIDADTGAALCPTDKCANIVPLLSRLEAERIEDFAPSAEPPVAMQAREEDDADEFTQPLSGGSNMLSASLGLEAAYAGSVSMLALNNNDDGLPD